MGSHESRQLASAQDQTGEGKSDLFSMLPDDVVIHIGVSVAECCISIKDYVSLSRTSKRLKALLLDSQETASRVIRARIALMENNAITEGKTDQTRLITMASTPVIPRTLLQLHVYESLAILGMLKGNRVKSSPEGSLQIVLSLAEPLRRMLRIHPSISIVFDVHFGTSANIVPNFDPFMLFCSTSALLFTIAEIDDHVASSDTVTKDRICVRAFGDSVSEQALQQRERNFYAEEITESAHWVDIFVRLQDTDGNLELELPPRPEFYRGAKSVTIDLNVDQPGVLVMGFPPLDGTDWF